MTPQEGLQMQIEAYRQMTGMERLAIGFRLNELARAEERASIRQQNPDWDERRVEREAVRRFGRKAGIPEELLPSPEEDEPIVVVHPTFTSVPAIQPPP